MVNVRAEYPEGYKVILDNNSSIHMKQDSMHEKEDTHNKYSQKDETLVICSNKEIEITGLTSGVIVKIPVVLAALTVQVNIDSLVELNEPIFQIKEISKNVNITQCRLIENSNVVFISGFISKKISYYTKTSSKEGIVLGEVKSITADIPFKCTTSIKYNILKPEDEIRKTVRESRYIEKDDGINNCLREDIENLENDLQDECIYINQEVVENYIDIPYCEVMGYKIIESERIIRKDEKSRNLDEKLGQYALEGKGSLNITMRILQKRLVSIL